MKQLLIFSLFIILVFMIDITPEDPAQMKKETISITVDGAVEQPGVYETQPYSTVSEVLAKAGISEDADLSVINPGTVLKDRDILIIPEKRTESRVSINTADLDTLCTLPGIGPTTAEKIIDYRNTIGLFQNTDDLQKVKGIGPKKYEKLKEFICL